VQSRRLLILFSVAASFGCEKKPPTTKEQDEARLRAEYTDARGIPKTREDTRFIKIRNLLGQDPDSPERSTKLYPLVEPICTDEKERKDFIEVAKWSAAFSHDKETLPTVLAIDTIDHVATSCFRNHPEAAFDVLARAKESVPDKYRYDQIAARLHAAGGDLDLALKEAKAAADGGSIHALALSANIEAQMAREKGAGYRAGMLDDAIKIVAVEPDAAWPLIDLTAVLSTRAHLLTERAVWEEPKKSIDTRKEAELAYRRLSVAPFIEATRSQSLDVLCFDYAEIPSEANLEACKRAAAEQGNLGAAVLAKVDRSKGLDGERLHKLEKLRDDLQTFPKKAVVLAIFRGDEQELVTWVLPAARILSRVERLGLEMVAVDRTKTARASTLVDRMLELAGKKPGDKIHAEDTLSMPCISAVLAERRTPQACPLPKAQLDRLQKLSKFGVALLIGRDLDAEIDDLHLYELRAALFSFRLPRVEKGLEVQAKSLSDVYIVAPVDGGRPE
jgi:hypothetical protein